MSRLRAAFRSGLGFEWLFVVLIAASVIHAAWYLFTYYHLPPPFFWEPGDVYADWFNVAYWARNKGTYDVWTALYPPLTFVLIRIVGIDRCYPRTRAVEPSPGLVARDCDWVGLASIWVLWIICIVLVYLAFRKNDKRTAIPRTICIGLGWPLLDGVERGNPILMALPCFLLATMPLVKSAKWRWFFAGMSINLKIYLIAPFVAQLFKRRWRWVEGVIISVILIYAVTFGILQRGSPIEVFHDVTDWANEGLSNPLDFWPATTYHALSQLLDSEDGFFPALLYLGSRNIELIQAGITIFLRMTQAALLGAMAAVWLRPEAVSRYRLFALGTLLALVTSESGGYTPVYFTALILLERWKGFGRIFSICGCYLLAISFDIRITPIGQFQRDTYYHDASILVDFYLTVWPFLRPAVIQAIAIALSCTTLREVWQDVRLQGWAQRWRFRGDAPILPGVLRPTPPDFRQ